MDRVVVKTPRLVLKRFSIRDAAGFFELNSDPEVLRFSGDIPFASIKEARTFIRAYRQYDLYGFGRWSVYLLDTNEYLGFCGLNFSTAKQEVDLGFRLMRRVWGQGFATEAGFACLRIGFSKYGLEKIVGRAMPENAASLRVLQKLGMTYEKEFDEDGIRWVQMSIRRDEFGNFYE